VEEAAGCTPQDKGLFLFLGEVEGGREGRKEGREGVKE